MPKPYRMVSQHGKYIEADYKDLTAQSVGEDRVMDRIEIIRQIEIGGGISTTSLPTPLRIKDGLEAKPELTFVNDDDNGLYRIGSDNYGLSVGGTLALELGGSSGKVAVIGDADEVQLYVEAPAAQSNTDVLQVARSNGDNLFSVYESGLGDPYLLIGDLGTINRTSAHLIIQNTSTVPHLMLKQANSRFAQFRMLSSGILRIDGDGISATQFESMDIQVDDTIKFGGTTGNPGRGILTHSNSSARTYTFPDASGTLMLGGGSGSADRVAYWSDANTLTSSASLTFDGSELTAASATISDLTSGRVVYASTSGALVDSANLTFDGSSLIVTGTVGIGESTPDAKLEVASTTEQLRLSHTAGSVYCALQVNSSGELTISQTGNILTLQCTETSANTVLFETTQNERMTLQIKTPGTAGGDDAQLLWQNGNEFWFAGIDTSDSNIFKLGNSSSVGDTGLAIEIDTNENVAIGPSGALATTATNGFLYIPTCAGAPTGTPTSITGKVPMIYDTSNDALYVYNSGWVSVTLA